MQMLYLIKKWMLDTNAEWYQFWMPQSGFVGGLIMGTVLSSFIILAFVI